MLYGSSLRREFSTEIYIHFLRGDKLRGAKQRSRVQSIESVGSWVERAKENWVSLLK